MLFSSAKNPSKKESLLCKLIAFIFFIFKQS
uniref:Uncharacterized protein n=1 Tax=Arundo donax TaxID=35708 RepID=A0A0A9ED17_ARUDO